MQTDVFISQPNPLSAYQAARFRPVSPTPSPKGACLITECYDQLVV